MDMIMVQKSRVPASGVWCPAVTFFDRETDELDLIAQSRYFRYLCKSGLTGLVVLGSNAEAFLLTRDERRTLIATARRAVGPQFPIIAGVGAHSTKQVLEHIADAKAAGADYALVLPAAYFGKATTPAVVETFFGDVAEKSSLPVVIYNFPGVCNGIDLESDVIARLAKRHENIVGVKLTCGSVAKITRLVAELPKENFATFAGQSDFLIGGLCVGSSGCISAFSNAFPKSISKIYTLYQEGKHDEALALHRKAALAEVVIKAGPAATKYAAAVTSAPAAGITDAEEKLQPRTPYQPLGEAVQKTMREKMVEMMEIENGL